MSEELRKRLISAINDELISRSDYGHEKAVAEDAAETLRQMGGRGGSTRAYVEALAVGLVNHFAEGDFDKPVEKQWPAARLLSGVRTPDPRVEKLVEALREIVICDVDAVDDPEGANQKLTDIDFLLSDWEDGK